MAREFFAQVESNRRPSLAELDRNPLVRLAPSRCDRTPDHSHQPAAICKAAHHACSAQSASCHDEPDSLSRHPCCAVHTTRHHTRWCHSHWNAGLTNMRNSPTQFFNGKHEANLQNKIRCPTGGP